MTTRKKYSPEYKLDAISLVTDQGYTRSAAAKSLGINAQMLGRWVQEHQSDNDKAFREKCKPSPEQKEIKRLKQQVKRLEMEKEILKKATVFFAAETK